VKSVTYSVVRLRGSSIFGGAWWLAGRLLELTRKHLKYFPALFTFAKVLSFVVRDR
jgi:hypothetical protein